MKDYLKPVLGPNVYVGSSDMKAKNINEVIQKIDNNNGVILSISPKDKLKNFKYFAMFGGSTSTEAHTKWNNFLQLEK